MKLLIMNDIYTDMVDEITEVFNDSCASTYTPERVMKYGIIINIIHQHCNIPIDDDVHHRYIRINPKVRNVLNDVVEKCVIGDDNGHWEGMLRLLGNCSKVMDVRVKHKNKIEVVCE